MLLFKFPVTSNTYASCPSNTFSGFTLLIVGSIQLLIVKGSFSSATYITPSPYVIFVHLTWLTSSEEVLVIQALF
jgi:hypothetical protein